MHQLMPDRLLQPHGRREAHLEVQQGRAVAQAAGGDPPQAVLARSQQAHIQADRESAARLWTPGLVCSAVEGDGVRARRTGNFNRQVLRRRLPRR